VLAAAGVGQKAEFFNGIGRSATIESERERLDLRRSQFDPLLPLSFALPTAAMPRLRCGEHGGILCPARSGRKLNLPEIESILPGGYR
jgi:hypothetical protein